MKVEVPLLSNSECNSLFKLAALEDRVEEDIWVCAGYREGGKDACEGDSGGPLVVAEGEGNEEVWQLAGDYQPVLSCNFWTCIQLSPKHTTQALSVGVPTAVVRSTGLEFTQGHPLIL